MMPRHPVFTDALLDDALGAPAARPPGDPAPSPRWLRPTALEALTRSPAWSPLAIAGAWLAAIAWLTPPAATSPAAACGRALAGALAWTFVEYALHRWVFHFQPRGDVGRVVTWLLHRHHHHHPGARDRLAATPPQALGLLIPVSVIAARADPQGWTWFAAGLGLAWLVYEGLHWSFHHRSPRTRLGRWLRRHHLHHHHVDDQTAFGISSPLWDLVLGTLPQRAPRR